MIADGGLTQQFDRPSPSTLPKICQARRRFFDCRSGNKVTRHMLNLASDGLAAEPSPQAGGGEGLESPVGAEECGVGVAKVLASQRDHLFVAFDRRQEIDESKQLRLEVAVMHGQIEGRMRPPSALKECRSSTRRKTSELFTDTGHNRLEGRSYFRHLNLPRSVPIGHRQYTLSAFA